MMKYIQILTLILILGSCESENPNLNKSGEDEFKSLEVTAEIDDAQMKYSDILYVPIYSDIYANAQNQNSLLAATLSIRNTSFTDTLYVSTVDYYNTEGALVKKYLENTISLIPMGTINYVIETEDDSGGPGANFIVELSCRNPKVKPLVQAVMISYIGNKAFSFSSDAYSVLEN